MWIREAIAGLPPSGGQLPQRRRAIMLSPGRTIGIPQMHENPPVLSRGRLHLPVKGRRNGLPRSILHQGLQALPELSGDREDCLRRGAGGR